MLITGRRTWFVCRRLDGRDMGEFGTSPLWTPPNKIAGKRLSPFLDALDTTPTPLAVG
jgi:hypothetical protein